MWIPRRFLPTCCLAHSPCFSLEGRAETERLRGSQYVIERHDESLSVVRMPDLAARDRRQVGAAVESYAFVARSLARAYHVPSFECQRVTRRIRDAWRCSRRACSRD